MQIHFRSELERKMLHISSIWVPAFLYFFPYWPSVIVFGSLFFIGVLAEIGYHRNWRPFHHLYKVAFGHILRTKERGKGMHLSGGVFVLFAAFICALFFSPEIGAMAMTVSLLADAMSGLIGRRFGKTRLCEGKSLEGSAAFLFTGFIIVTLFEKALNLPQEMYVLSIIAVILSTIAELLSGKLRIDDNLSSALIFGITMSIFNY